MDYINKIVDMEILAGTLRGLKKQGKKIIHCHGVFDLVHIGHIRHLKQAKKRGDVLIVTVTPDKYVNKGPHRPVFHENLPAESIAALGFVGYVAINKWPTAVQAIKCLKPDIYIKGAEYRSAVKDITGGIDRESAAVASVGGRLEFTEDIVFSSSNLINKCFPVYPKEVTDYLKSFSKKYSFERISEYIKSAKSLKVLVVGDSIIDEYNYCLAIGKSSKEPMLAVKSLSCEKFAGGVLAVANNISNFCEQAGLITVLGQQNSHEGFIRRKLSDNIKKMFVYRKDAPTVLKKRFIEKYFFTKMLEVYDINDALLGDRENRQLCRILKEQIPKYDVVVVFDFGHGMLTKEAIKIICKKARFLVVNSQSNAANLGYHTISRYPRADYVCIAEPELRLEVRDKQSEDIKKMVLKVAQSLKCPKVNVTRGICGCLCYDHKEGFYDVPALATHVIDRMGAGDAFLSITALCVAQNAPIELAGFVGNAVGAQAVATVGHRSSIEYPALIKHIESILK